MVRTGTAERVIGGEGSPPCKAKNLAVKTSQHREPLVTALLLALDGRPAPPVALPAQPVPIAAPLARPVPNLAPVAAGSAPASPPPAASPAPAPLRAASPPPAASPAPASLPRAASPAPADSPPVLGRGTRVRRPPAPDAYEAVLATRAKERHAAQLRRVLAAQASSAPSSDHIE